MSDPHQSIDWFARISGVAGVITGVCSLIWQFRRTRPRLRVVPGIETYGEAFGGPTTDIVIKVVNLSEFPVVIEEAGVQFSDGEIRPLKFTHTFEKGGDIDTQKLPVTLAARNSIVIKSSEQDGIKASLILSSYPATYAYVRTADGYVKRGTSKELRERVAGAGSQSDS